MRKSRGSFRPDAPRVLVGTALLLTFVGLTAFFTYPQILYLDRGVGPHADPLLRIWTLSWIAHQLPVAPRHLFDANIFHPEARTLAYSDAVLLPALTAAPLLWLGVHPVLAYNLVFLSGFVFSGLGTYLLVRSLTRRRGAAVFAGIVFAFAPYRFEHYIHLDMQMAQWMPLALWALHRTLEASRVRDGLLMGLFLALQALSCLYYAIFFVTYLGLLIPLLLMTGSVRRRVKVVGALAAGGVLMLTLVWPYSIPFLRNRQMLGDRQTAEIQQWSATPQSYLASTATNSLYGASADRFGRPEGHLFPGALVVALALVALWPPSSPLCVAYLVGLLFAFEASLGLNGFSYRWLLASLPPYGGLRVPARFAALVLLSLAVLGGHGLARICARLSARWGAAVSVACAVVALAEYRNVPLTLQIVAKKPPVIYTWLRQEPPAVLLELPLPRPGDPGEEGRYMYHSIFHWHKLVNGWSGFFPRSYLRLLEIMRSFPDDRSVSELRSRDVKYVIVHSQFYEPQVYAKLRDSLRHQAGLALVGAFPARGGESVLYKVLR